MIEEHVSMVIRAGSGKMAMFLANKHVAKWGEALWSEETVRVEELSDLGPTKILSCGGCWKAGAK